MVSWYFSWGELSQAVKDLFETMFDVVKHGKPFFFNLDDTDDTDTRYVYAESHNFSKVPPLKWSMNMTIREAN